MLAVEKSTDARLLGHRPLERYKTAERRANFYASYVRGPSEYMVNKFNNKYEPKADIPKPSPSPP